MILFFHFQFAAPTLHRQDGPAFAGLLLEVEQPSEQLTDGVGPPVSNGGVLRRDASLRQHFYQMPQNDPLRLLILLSNAVYGEHLRTPHRLPQGHQDWGGQSHSRLHVQGRGQHRTGNLKLLFISTSI